MSYELRLSRAAARYASRLDSDTKRRIEARLDDLATDPWDSSVSKALTGLVGLRSSRVESIRIVYRVVENRVLVLVERVGPRGQVYRNL